MIAFDHVGILDSHKLISLPLSLSCSLTAATREITAGPKHTRIFILSWWMDPLLITQHTLARSQWKCGYYLSVRIAARTTFPLPSHIRPWPRVSTLCVCLPYLAGLPTVISLPLGSSHSSTPSYPPSPPSRHPSHRNRHRQAESSVPLNLHVEAATSSLIVSHPSSIVVP